MVPVPVEIPVTDPEADPTVNAEEPVDHDPPGEAGSLRVTVAPLQKAVVPMIGPG